MVTGLGAHLPLSESQANRSAEGQVYCSKASTDFEQPLGSAVCWSEVQRFMNNPRPLRWLPTPTFSILGTMPLRAAATLPHPSEEVSAGYQWGQVLWGQGLEGQRSLSCPGCLPFSLWYILTSPPFLHFQNLCLSYSFVLLGQSNFFFQKMQKKGCLGGSFS